MIFSWPYFVLLIPGAPLLGSAQTVKATLSGDTYGLPISEVTSLLPHFEIPQNIMFLVVLLFVKLSIFVLYVINFSSL